MAILRVREEDGRFYEIPAIKGKSAYIYATEAGYEGTEAEFSQKLAASSLQTTFSLSDNTIISSVSISDCLNIYNMGAMVLGNYNNLSGSLSKIEDNILIFNLSSPNEGTQMEIKGQIINGIDIWTATSEIEFVKTKEITNVDKIALTETQTALLQLIYPVGALYLSTVNTNPNNLFGFGIWEQIEDRFLLAAGTTYENGTTGGNSEVALQRANAPYSAFGVQFHNSTTGTPLASVWSNDDIINVKKIQPGYRDGGNYSASTSESIGSFTYNNGGTSEPFSILPPYLAVYVWKRVS